MSTGVSGPCAPVAVDDAMRGIFGQGLAGNAPATSRTRRLHLALGDQLDPGAAPLRDLDPAPDVVFMTEVHEEARHVVWDLLLRHRRRLSNNRRMRLVMSSLERMDRAEMSSIGGRARALRRRFGVDRGERPRPGDGRMIS